MSTSLPKFRRPGRTVGEADMELMQDIREIIRGRRELLGISARELSKQVGVHPNTIFNCEAGWYFPRLPIIRRILNALGLEFKIGVHKCSEFDEEI